MGTVQQMLEEKETTMRYRQRTAFFCIVLLSVLVLGVMLVVSAQYRMNDTPSQTDQYRPPIQHGMMETQRQADQVRKTAAPAPTLSASLTQPEHKTKRHEAGVQVHVVGIDLIDPAMTNEKPEPGQGHLHYQLDAGPMIVTTATKLTFHKLSPGKHQITVLLTGNDHSPLGPREVLHVTVPER